MTYVAPSTPLTIGGVLDNWIRIFRSSFGSCWAFALLAAIAGAAVQLTITPMLPTAGPPSLHSYLQYWASLRGPSTLLTDLVFWLVSVVVYGAVLTQQAALIRGEEPFSFGDAFGKGLRRVPQMLLGFVLLVLIVTAICAPIGIGVALMIPFHPPGSAIFLGVLVAIALVILLIYVMVRLQLWMAAMFSENSGASASLGRSWNLVKGHWWRVTGIGFVSAVVVWVLSMAVGAVAGIVVGIMGISGTSPNELLHRLQLIGAATQLVRLLTIPLLTAVWFAIYQDLILRREGGDLAARAEALSGN
ncbi:MAG: hypothetical protein ACYDAE_10970 [Steroidobacteraceae bacterium]